MCRRVTPIRRPSRAYGRSKPSPRPRRRCSCCRASRECRRGCLWCGAGGPTTSIPRRRRRPTIAGVQRHLHLDGGSPVPSHSPEQAASNLSLMVDVALELRLRCRGHRRLGVPRRGLQRLVRDGVRVLTSRGQSMRRCTGASSRHDDRERSRVGKRCIGLLGSGVPCRGSRVHLMLSQDPADRVPLSVVYPCSTSAKSCPSCHAASRRWPVSCALRTS